MLCFQGQDPPSLISQCLWLSLTKVGARREERSPWSTAGAGCDSPSPGHPTRVTSNSHLQPQQGLGAIWGHKQHLSRKWRKLTKNATLGRIVLTLSKTTTQKKKCKYRQLGKKNADDWKWNLPFKVKINVVHSEAPRLRDWVTFMLIHSRRLPSGYEKWAYLL